MMNKQKPSIVFLTTFLWLTITWIFAGCEKKTQSKYDEELTLVVKADDRQVVAERAALAEQRKFLEERKATLLRKGTRPECTGWRELLEEQAEMLKKQEKLDQMQESLIDKLTASQEAQRITENELMAREMALREREKALANGWNVLAERSLKVGEREKDWVDCAARQLEQKEVSLQVLEKSSGLGSAQVDSEYRRLLLVMSAKGILIRDAPTEIQHKLAAAMKSKKSEPARALAAVEALQDWVQSIPLDSRFLTEKNRRLAPLADKIAKSSNATDARSREDVIRFRREYTQAYSDGRYIEANRVLNNISAIVEK